MPFQVVMSIMGLAEVPAIVVAVHDDVLYMYDNTPKEYVSRCDDWHSTSLKPWAPEVAL